MISKLMLILQFCFIDITESAPIFLNSFVYESILKRPSRWLYSHQNFALHESSWTEQTTSLMIMVLRFKWDDTYLLISYVTIFISQLFYKI